MTEENINLEEYFSGKGGDEYTKRNKNSVNEGKTASGLIYNVIKMKKIKSVCEIGTNLGHNLSRLDGYCNLICGVDINKKAIKEGKKLYPFINFTEGSAYSIPLYENSFELVFSRGLIIHLEPEKIKDALSEMKRVSKKFIINIEYGVEDDKNLNEEVEWRDGNKLWRVNMRKYWEQVSGVKVKDYFKLPLEEDKENMMICVVEKKK